MATGVTSFRGLSAFFATELRVQLHESTAIFTSIVVQVVLLLFVAILAPNLIGIALLGAIVFSMFTLGQRVLNESAYIRIDHKLNQLYLASPLTPAAYFFGTALGVLVAYLAPIVILVVITEVVTPLSLATALVLPTVALAVWLFSVSIGYIASTMFRDNRAIWSYASLFYNLFGVLPPVFYPIALFPSELRPVALAMPPSAASGLLQWTLNRSVLSFGEVEFAATTLVVEAVAAFLFALYWARRTVRER